MVGKPLACIPELLQACWVILFASPMLPVPVLWACQLVLKVLVGFEMLGWVVPRPALIPFKVSVEHISQL